MMATNHQSETAEWHAKPAPNVCDCAKYEWRYINILPFLSLYLEGSRSRLSLHVSYSSCLPTDSESTERNSRALTTTEEITTYY